MLAGLAAGLLLLYGCGQGTVTGGDAKLEAGEGSPGFLDRVSSQKTVSENDALRGMLILLYEEDKTATFRQRVDTLTDRGIVSGRWDLRADRPLTKGRLAYMVYQACKVPGGVMLALLGPTERYCLRELQYRGMISPGVWYTPVSGQEFVAIMTRAAEYRDTGKVLEAIKATRAW